MRRSRLSRMATRDEYFDWLCDVVNMDNIVNDYTALLKELHDTPFRWHVPNDDNRAFEGTNLRELFCDELNIQYDIDSFDPECSMLELILGLAFRCESIISDHIDNVTVAEWFWKLLDNAGLTKFEDKFRVSVGETVHDIVEKIIKRTYKRDGHGGLFPLSGRVKDQRKVELWYQMSLYLSELYYPRG